MKNGDMMLNAWFCGGIYKKKSDFFSRLAAVGSLLLLVATVLGIYASILIVRGNHHGDKSYNWCCRYGTYDPSPAMLCQNQLCCAGARKGEDHPYLGGPGVCDYKEGIHRPYKDALDPRLKDPNYHWSQWYCEKDTCGDKISLCGPERFDFGNSTAQKIEEILRRNQACCNIDRCIHKDDVANACVCSWVFAILSLISVMAFRFCDSNTPLFSCNEKGFPPWRWIWYPAFFIFIAVNVTTLQYLMNGIKDSIPPPDWLFPFLIIMNVVVMIMFLASCYLWLDELIEPPSLVPSTQEMNKEPQRTGVEVEHMPLMQPHLVQTTQHPIYMEGNIGNA